MLQKSFERDRYMQRVKSRLNAGQMTIEERRWRGGGEKMRRSREQEEMRMSDI